MRIKFWQRHDAEYRAALKFVKQYGYKGRSLPKGQRKSSGRCPVAVALRQACPAFPHLAVARNAVLWELPDTFANATPLPAAVSRFIVKFDYTVAYPELRA